MYLEQGVFYYDTTPYGAAVYAVSKLTMPPVCAAEFLFLPVFAVFAVAIQPQQGGNIDFGCAKGILRFAQLGSQIEEAAVIVVRNAQFSFSVCGRGRGSKRHFRASLPIFW
jgi:hypothetical protein